jgi:hypothetical protein
VKVKLSQTKIRLDLNCRVRLEARSWKSSQS